MAEDLGCENLNTLLNLVINRALPKLLLEAHVLRESMNANRTVPLLGAFRKAYPKGVATVLG